MITIGGFSVFKKQYPLLCTNTSPNTVFISSIVNKTKRSNSKYIHTWPFKSKTVCSFKPLTPKSTILCNNFPAFVFDDPTGPAEILPYLFLGSESHAKTKNVLLDLGITAILNVSQNCPNYYEDLFHYKRIPIRDSKCDDIISLIGEALDFIGKSLHLAIFFLLSLLFSHSLFSILHGASIFCSRQRRGLLVCTLTKHIWQIIY